MIWASAMISGFASLWRYENTAGAQAEFGDRWPRDSHVLLDAHHFTLVAFMHPQCPCSKASVANLVVLSPVVWVVAVMPLGMADSPWITVELVQAAIWPAVGVPLLLTFPDPAGVEQLAVPAAVTPVANCPEVHCAGVAARAVAVDAVVAEVAVVAVAALPVVDWFRVGKLVSSAALTAGSWALELSCTRSLATMPTV